jgi:hypothetical protein
MSQICMTSFVNVPLNQSMIVTSGDSKDTNEWQKSLPNFIFSLFNCLRHKIGCLTLTKQGLICICSVLVQGSLVVFTSFNTGCFTPIRIGCLA